jgi:hypothetical protein
MPWSFKISISRPFFRNGLVPIFIFAEYL